MVFSSVTFLFYFLPIFLMAYFAVPKKLKNVVLFLFSLFFYGWGEPKYVIWMLIATVQGYLFGRWIEKAKQEKQAKALMTISVMISLALLCYLKYMDFFIGTMNVLFRRDIPFLKIALPIGISFYTFQLIGYVVDVYRKQVVAQKNYFHFAAYLTMFSQLIAGPIIRYQDIEKELVDRKHTLQGVSGGCRRFVIGLSKKILIANVLWELIEVYKNAPSKTILFTWMYALAYTLYVYFDFSGYSDMAIGLGEIMGFHFPENFNYPYIAGSITEFWRRWHISLGSWFRDYLYIPLGGNRVSKVKWFRNIIIVWAATGLWHGADWNFVLWGLMFAVLLIIEKAGFLSTLAKSAVWKHFYVLFFVIMSFVIFDAENVRQIGIRFCDLFGASGISWMSEVTGYYLQSYCLVFLAAMIGATPLPKLVIARLNRNKAGARVLLFVEPICLFLLLSVCTAFLVDESYNPFLYFRF